jgi:hypothetical protein
MGTMLSGSRHVANAHGDRLPGLTMGIEPIAAP